MLSLIGYQNLKKISEVGDWVLYSGNRESDRREVVVKALRPEHPSVDLIALLYHEYAVVKELNLPGLLQIYELIDQKNQYALVEENMHGISFQAYLQKNPILNLERFLNLAISMTKIIEELHRHHIIHKDIKPDNFLIHPETLTIKLTNFAFSSKLLHETQDLVPPSKLEGTLAYMAPEQSGRMNRNIDYRADFYALGVTFYEMLSASLPFSYNDPLELLHAHIANPVPEVFSVQFDIPPLLIELVQRLMAKNPSERYQSATGLLADLERIQKSLEETGRIEFFPLGEQDIFDQLNLSQKLYGREKEAKLLLATYDRVSRGALECLMVCGYSGIGKTALINEMHQSMLQHKGYFISGKFDQLQRSKPYTAITQAFNQLARLILAEPEPRFEAIKQDIINSLKGAGEVVTDLIPDLERVIGPQAPLEKLPAQATQNRMMSAFKRFLGAIASEEHPLVIFIDDLQWIDSGSLALLEYVMTDEDLSYLLLIGAYRDNEVDLHHPLKKFITDVEAKGKSIPLLSLGPLMPEHFCELFKDSLHRDEASVKPLADFIHSRTQGNPFFCKQLINTLYKEHLLYFDYENRRWDWDLKGIHALSITDNVVDLMVGRLGELELLTQDVLKYAACIGNRFTIETLILITGQSAEVIGQALWPALQQELIITPGLSYKRIDAMRQKILAESLVKNITYQFIHDRVQQAAYQSIAKEEKQKTHLKIARLLIEKEPEACKRERLFEVTDHFNQAHELLKQDEIILVTNLNYESGIQARNSNAYQAMETYLKAALNLMDESWWEIHHDLAFKINLEYAQSLYFVGKIEENAAHLEVLLPRAKSGFEKAQIYAVQAIQMQTLGKLLEAVDLSIKALALLGIKIKKNATKFDLWIQYRHIKWSLRRKKLEKIGREFQDATDPAILLASRIVTQTRLALVWAEGHTGRYLSLLMMRLFLRHGFTSVTPIIFMTCSDVVMNIFHDLNFAFTLWDSTLKILKQKNINPLSIYMVAALRIYHLRYPYKEAQLNDQKYTQLALESGNFMAAATCMANECVNIQWQGKSLPHLEETAEKALAYAKKIRFSEMEKHSEIALTLIKYQLLKLPIDEPELIKLQARFEANQGLWTMATQFISSTFYLLEKYTLALKYHRQWFKNEDTMGYFTTSFNTATLNALSIMKLISTVSYRERLQLLWRFRKLRKKLVLAAKNCPYNFLHQCQIIDAAYYAYQEKTTRALRLLDMAIKNAKEGDYYIWVAIANELAAEICQEEAISSATIHYAKEAYFYFKLYGLTAKLQALRNRYPDYLLTIEEGAKPGFDRTYTTTTTSAALDYMSIIKASQTISGEIILEKLFQKMLHIALENVGAERAIFLEHSKNAWSVVASLVREEDEERFEMLDVELEKFDNLPRTMIQFSLRSEEAVVLNNAAEDNQYRQDPYIFRAKPKSVLCLPVLHQDKVVGLIYLENNLTPGAFTQDRVTVLTTLASQIAISLESSHYLAHVEKLYEKTQRFVPKKFLEIIHRENIEEVSLGDSAKREISVLFNDIRSFTSLVENRSPEEAFAFINRYWKFMAPIIRKHGGYIDQYQGDAILAIFPNKPEDAVRAAVAMMAALTGFNVYQQENNDVPISMGIGVSTGLAMLGVIGEEERQVSGVISDVANTAARVEGLNKSYGSRILLSDATALALPDNFELYRRRVDKVRLKGKKQVTELFEIIEWAEELKSISIEDYLNRFAKAFEVYEQGQFKMAESLFSACLEIFPRDKAAAVLQERCQGFLRSPPPADWGGAFTLVHK